LILSDRAVRMRSVEGEYSSRDGIVITVKGFCS
jgi:hypothetical protein